MTVSDWNDRISIDFVVLLSIHLSVLILNYQLDWRASRTSIYSLSILTRNDNETNKTIGAHESETRYLIIQFHGEFVDNYNRMKITHKHTESFDDGNEREKK